MKNLFILATMMFSGVASSATPMTIECIDPKWDRLELRLQIDKSNPFNSVVTYYDHRPTLVKEVTVSRTGTTSFFANSRNGYLVERLKVTLTKSQLVARKGTRIQVPLEVVSTVNTGFGIFSCVVK